MHPYLTKLGVTADVQGFFHESCRIDAHNNLLFSYGDCVETYGLAFHRIPVTAGLWIAGNNNYSMIRQVFICSSAMDAIAFLNLNRKRVPDPDHLLFVATGLRPCKAQLDWISANFPHHTVSLLYGNDLIGQITDLKIAAGICGLTLTVNVADNLVNVRFRYRDYHFTIDVFSLNQFERQSGQRFRCRTFKPRQADSWATQLFQKLAKK